MEGKFLGFVNALVLALFAYMGTELVGVTVGEAKVSVSSLKGDRVITPEPKEDRPIGHPKDLLPNPLLLHPRCSHHRYDCRLELDPPRSSR